MSSWRRSPGARRGATASAICSCSANNTAGLFYNPHVMEAAGITTVPTDWEGFLAMC
ncbi:MAG: hypothetical protein IPK17_39000 [Chloroflexi bacterium]|uniref:hypothetical protein n=1 Tax=Candidatus Flexifilum breve TaxID=3140694 RepID=UPI003135D01D|nr:hypothetical protein [Chloroflexota bacterium]